MHHDTDTYDSHDTYVLRLMSQTPSKMDIVAHDSQKHYTDPDSDMRITFRVSDEYDDPTFRMTLLSEIPISVTVDSDNRMMESGESITIFDNDDLTINGVTYVAAIEVREITHVKPPGSYTDRSLYVRSNYKLSDGGRSSQEDALGFCSQEARDGSVEHLWLVADGVAGAHYGEVASQFAVQYMLWYFFNHAGDPRTRLTQGALNASQHIAQFSKDLTAQKREADPEHYKIRLATTMTAVAMVDKKWHIMIVGDSCALLYSPYRAEKTTWYDDPNARDGDGRLRFALGKPKLSQKDIYYKLVDISITDFIMLTTDGLTDVVPPQDIVRKFHNIDITNDEWIDLPNAFEDAAMALDGGDNMSIIVARLHVEEQGSNTYHWVDPPVYLNIPDDEPDITSITPQNKHELEEDHYSESAGDKGEKGGLFDRFRRKRR